MLAGWCTETYSQKKAAAAIASAVLIFRALNRVRRKNNLESLLIEPFFYNNFIKITPINK
jgi:hypothetical protein